MWKRLHCHETMRRGQVSFWWAKFGTSIKAMVVKPWKAEWHAAATSPSNQSTAAGGRTDWKTFTQAGQRSGAAESAAALSAWRTSFLTPSSFKKTPQYKSFQACNCLKLKTPEGIGKSITFTSVETPHLKIPPLKCGLALGRRVKETSVCEWIYPYWSQLTATCKSRSEVESHWRWRENKEGEQAKKGRRMVKKKREHPPLPQISLGPRQSD